MKSKAYLGLRGWVPVAIVGFLSTLLISGCVTAAQPGKGRSVHALARTVHLTYVASIPSVTVPTTGYSTSKSVVLTADRDTGSPYKLIAETRTLTLTYTNRSTHVAFQFYVNFAVPSSNTYPKIFPTISVPVTIPVGNPGTYDIALNASVRFDDDPAVPVVAVPFTLVTKTRPAKR